ncbi:hypothetical protein STEG23_005396, partial [Scotinomys teguina]
AEEPQLKAFTAARVQLPAPPLYSSPPEGLSLSVLRSHLQCPLALHVLKGKQLLQTCVDANSILTKVICKSTTPP